MIPPALLQALAGMQGQQQAPNPEQYYGGLGQQIDAQQPYQEPVPQGPNPFTSMGSVFAGTLADMLGAHGAQRQAQERVQERQAMPIQAQLRNQERRAQMLHDKEAGHLDLRIKLADAKYKAAVAASEDLKAQQALADKNKHELAKMKLDHQYDTEIEQIRAGAKLDVADLAKQGRMDVAELKATPDQAKTQATNDRAVQAFNAGLDRIRGAKGTKQSPEGSMKTERVGGHLGFGGQKVSTYTPGGARRIREYASAAANTSNPDVAHAALGAYLDTIVDPATGGLNTKDATATKQFEQLLNKIFPDAASARQWLLAQGVTL